MVNQYYYQNVPYVVWYGLWRFKDLAKRTPSDKVLRDKTFNIAKNPKYDGYQRGLASMVYKFFAKKPEVVVLLTLVVRSIFALRKQPRRTIFTGKNLQFNGWSKNCHNSCSIEPN